jgi:hypothetical protein
MLQIGNDNKVDYMYKQFFNRFHMNLCKSEGNITV